MRTLIADDHDMVREGMCLLLEYSPTAEFEVVQASSWPECLRAAREHVLELAIVDLYMPTDGDTTGFDALATLRAENPDLPVIILSGSEDPADALQVLELGARGFVLKAVSAEVLISAVQLVLAGGIYLPTSLLSHPGIVNLNAARPPAPTAATEEAPRAGCACAQLTERQQQVLTCMSAGRSNKEIARDMDLALSTVKTHASAIFEVLGVTSRTEAVSRVHSPCMQSCLLSSLPNAT